MNRAEKRRQQKLAKKVAKNAKNGQLADPSAEQQISPVQKSLVLGLQHQNAGDLRPTQTLPSSFPGSLFFSGLWN
jgi:hypothetical protein